MVSLVYFGADLSKELGDSLYCFCADPEPHWVTGQDLELMLNAGETVTIRPATFVEFLRAESSIASHKISQEICQQLLWPSSSSITDQSQFPGPSSVEPGEALLGGM